MKDTVVTARRKKTELFTFLICFLIANLLNVYAIIAYDTYFKEIITQIGYVFVFAVGLYLAWSILRIVFYLILKIFNTNKTQTK